MGSVNFKNGRGYLYIALGVGFGVYRGMKVISWTSSDYLDMALALGMVSIGVYLVFKN